ncbi:hypothetical protein ATY81_07975 [Rhizobium sp. R72]|uniref:hypothetical protein n=1 Tax=unclassified Rhizobium TaxID=2613769 RepID=UPI000B532F69|nr:MULTISPECIES: hypothetical protein [unclassified Rhizobium]OWV97368.1 hypothetical protein ATY81_07975 [Rhizobium sp. R72]OWV97707.1 hypothetical protein ATY80_07975 [Rhizobium sp. R711]
MAITTTNQSTRNHQMQLVIDTLLSQIAGFVGRESGRFPRKLDLAATTLFEATDGLLVRFVAYADSALLTVSPQNGQSLGFQRDRDGLQ